MVRDGLVWVAAQGSRTHSWRGFSFFSEFSVAEGMVADVDGSID